MAGIRRKGERYYAYFYDPEQDPREKWLSLRTTRKDVARIKLSKLEKDQALGLFDPWGDKQDAEVDSIKDAITMYLHGRKDRRPKTLREDEKVLRLFAAGLGPVKLKRIDRQDIEAFLRPELADASRHTYFARLSAFFNWCVEESLLKTSPMSRLKRPRVAKREPVFLERDDYDRLLNAVDAHKEMNSTALKEGEVVWMGDVIRFAVGSGLRLSELCNLNWGDVNHVSGQVTVRNRGEFKTKSGHERTVFVAGDALDVLRTLRATVTSPNPDDAVFRGVSGGRLNATYVSKRFKKFVRLAKLKDEITFHTLRHTYASWLVIGGVDLYRVRDLLGHSTITLTERYAHLAPRHHRDDVERIFGPSRLPVS